MNKGPAPDTSPTKVGQLVDGAFKSVMSNGTSNDDTFKSENSSRRFQHCHLTRCSKSIGARSNAELGNLDSMKLAKSEIEPVSVPKKRSRKSSSLMNPAKGYDHSCLNWLETMSHEAEVTNLNLSIGDKKLLIKRRKNEKKKGYDNSWICTGRKTPNMCQ